MRRPRTWALLPALALALTVGCGGSKAEEGGQLLIVVDAPFSRTPALGETIARGAELAAAEINGTGRVIAGGHVYGLKIRRLDNGLSARRSAENVRRAIDIREGEAIDEAALTALVREAVALNGAKKKR